MNAIVTDNKVEIKGFRGLFNRGLSDSCPQDHLSECCNARFPGADQIKTREGTIRTHLTLEPIVYFFQAVLPTRTFLLMLGISGTLYDGDTPLITFTGYDGTPADGLTAINLYNRVYLCPTYRGQPLETEWVYYYDGTNLTKAAGEAPASVPDAAHANAGIVELGVHRITVVFITRTGFITPGPKDGNGLPIYASDLSPGERDIELTNIPTGPEYVVGRRILATKANEEEFFFVPASAMSVDLESDNSTTSVDLDFLDTDLTISADYLFDLQEEVPAGAALRFYKGRLAVIASLTGNRTQVWLSRVQDPESFSTVNGMVTFPVHPYTNPLTTGLELRDVLYVASFVGVWATQDNGDVPSNWPVSVVDHGFGCYDRGVSALFSTGPAQDEMDMVLVADKNGLYIFDGMFRLPPLTWKIDDIWRNLLYDWFYRITIAHDIWYKRFFISVPLGAEGASGINAVLMMDYNEGLSADKVRWSIWTFPHSPTCIGMANPEPDYTYVLRISSADDIPTSCILGLWIDAVTDEVCDGSEARINFIITTAPVPMYTGYVSVYTGIRFRVLGAGKMVLEIAGEDLYGTREVLGLDLALQPGQELFRMINFTNEKMQLTMMTDLHSAVPSWIHLNRVELFGVRRWMLRPVTPGA